MPLTALDRLNFCADELDSRHWDPMGSLRYHASGECAGLNEQFLLCGTTVELAEYAQTTGEAQLRLQMAGGI